MDEKRSVQAPRDFGMSFSTLKPRKIGRKLSRSMSIVALKLPEKGASYFSRAPRVRGPPPAKKGDWTFELAVIAPDKTQRQITASAKQKISDLVDPLLVEFGLELAEPKWCAHHKRRRKNEKKKNKKEEIPIVDEVEGEDPPPRTIKVAPKAVALLGGSQALVDVTAAAGLLEGEVLILQLCAEPWDGVDLNCFLNQEREYASAVGSAIELYAKPLLKANMFSQREYHILFYHLHCVSEASKTLCQRLDSYIEAGALKNTPASGKENSIDSEACQESKDNNSILFELVSEGFLTRKDIDLANLSLSNDDEKIIAIPCSSIDDIDGSSNQTKFPKIVLSDFEGNIEKNCQIIHEADLVHSKFPSSDTSKARHAAHDASCGADFKSIEDRGNNNFWQNMRWDFLDNMEEEKSKKPTNSSLNDVTVDSNYDCLTHIKRSQSETKLSGSILSDESIYESVEEISEKKDLATPYESIEDLYDCIKKQICGENTEIETVAPKINTIDHKVNLAEKVLNANFYDGLGMIRNNSSRSIKSGSVTSYATSVNSDSNKMSDEASEPANTEVELSQFIPARRESDSFSESQEDNENKILLNQLINGELLDVYLDFLSGYVEARNLLQEKTKADEHFSALVEIRRGSALYSIEDYLEMPIERLAQYERLAGAGGAQSARRRGQRLSDLERVQDLFPNDFLALHEHDVIAATAGTLKTKAALRKRPSLEAALGAGAGAGASPLSPLSPLPPPPCQRQFLMEAPCAAAPAPALAAPTPPPAPQDRHLFLFTDLMLLAKARGNNSFKLKEAVRLSEAWASAGSSDTSFLLGWAGAASPSTHLLTYPTQAARDSWLRKIQSALNTQLAFEPKTTNVQIVYKDVVSAIEFSKTLSITPEMTTAMVIRQALQLVQGGVSQENVSSWGPARDFCLWARASRDSVPIPLIGCERPHAIQMSRIRQTLSNDEGFDLEHVNSKNNPCGMVFELRKINRSVIKTRTPLKLFRRSSGRLFGVSLVRLCPGGVLPSAVLTMLRAVHRRGPHTQGIFRKSANVKALKHLREKVDNAGAAGARCPELDSAPVLLVASLLKDFLRSLPQPLMCDSLYPVWVSILGLTLNEKIPAMRSLLLKLPKSHYNLLSHFIALLQAIARKSSINLMCPMNLAVCVGPSLLWPTQPCEAAPKAVPPLIELLIIHAETLFGPQVNNIFGKGSPEPSASISLDSGAEESDSLHSVGLSLDSLDLNCNRKEKLSLSRDSGLTLSEDDSNSNGGNSPAPRNGLVHQALPQTGIQTHQAQRVYAKCYTNDLQNINGLPKMNVGNYEILRKKNMYANNSDIELHSRKYHENVYGTSADVKKTIESQQKIYNSITAHNRYNSDYHDAQAIYGNAGQSQNVNNNRLIQNSPQSSSVSTSSPSKYLTGYEPEKPPRLGMSRAHRNAKVYSMHVENSPEHTPPARLYCRAKSSEDLLERRNERIDEHIYGARGSQENIYSNLKYDSRSRHIRPKIQKQTVVESENKTDVPMQSYSRVYGGWEQRVSNLTNPSNRQNISTYLDENHRYGSKQTVPESIYEISSGGSSRQMPHHINSQKDLNQPPNSTIFTRKDWSRQASRTKSLDVAGADGTYPPGTYQTDVDTETAQIYMSRDERLLSFNESRMNNINTVHGYQCNIRSIDPAHVCSKKCNTITTENENTDIPSKNLNPLQNSHSMKNISQKCSPKENKNISHEFKQNTRKQGYSPKYDKNTTYANKLVHSKSLANIVLHSNSSSNDTLYQPSNYLIRDSPVSSENSFNNYNSEVPEKIYGSHRRNDQQDVFCENIYGKMGSREGIYSSDIYTAKPTSVGTSYSAENLNDSNMTNKKNNESIDNQRKVGKSVPIPPPVPPRKASHHSPLKNLPPVHLVGEDRKARTKSNPSTFRDSTSDKKQHGSEEDHAPCLRAPITSYHLGNSDKFILALDDSGTDTESESYV